MTATTGVSSLKEREASLEGELVLFEASLGLGAPSTAPDWLEQAGQKYLGMPPEGLARMSATEAGEAAVCLFQLAFHVQKAFNRERARLRWAEESQRKVIARTVASCPGGSYEERKGSAIQASPLAQELDALRVRCLVRSERISGLVEAIESLARAFLSLQASKRGKHD